MSIVRGPMRRGGSTGVVADVGSAAVGRTPVGTFGTGTARLSPTRSPVWSVPGPPTHVDPGPRIGDDLRVLPRPDRIATILAAVLVPLGLATALALVGLWPTGAAPETGVVDVAAEYPHARVVALDRRTCSGENEDRLPDGRIPDTVPCLRLTVEVLDGDASGRTLDIWAPATVGPADAPVGTRIVLVRYLETPTEPEVFAWYDFARAVPLAALAGVFALAVVVVAGVRGLRALVGLGLSFGVIGAFMLPAILRGTDPFAVGVVGSSAIIFVVLYLAHGFSRRTSVALLGTLAGLAATAGLGALAAHAAHVTGIENEDAYRLAQLTGHLDGQGLRGVFLAGVVLAGLGVLNDVTITQASAVWELRAANPAATRADLFRGGMRIGRDHIASTVYTIAFAYAGAALPVLLLLEVYRLPLWQTLSTGEFAEEVARTLVGSIGLVLAIPLTTAIAAVVVTAQAELPAERAPGRGRRRATGDGLGHVH